MKKIFLKLKKGQILSLPYLSRNNKLRRIIGRKQGVQNSNQRKLIWQNNGEWKDLMLILFSLNPLEESKFN